MAILLFFGILVLGILLDQLTKFLAVKYLLPIPTKPIIQDVLHLTYSENTGMAFGMLKEHRWIFIVLSTVAIICIIVYFLFYCKQGKWIRVSLALICSGGIGNMIDRVGKGFVVDFIDFRLIHFAIFNFADSLVCVGAFMLVIGILFFYREEEKTNLKEKKKKK